MGTVAVVIVGSDLTGHRHATDAVHAVRVIDVLGEIRMRVVEPGVDVAHQHRWTATSDGMRLRGVDLAHIPLKRRQRIRISGRRVRQITWRRTGGVRARSLVIVHSWNADSSSAQRLTTALEPVKNW